MNRIVLILILCGFVVAPAVDAQPFTRIIVFGDSLSDNGNLFAEYGTPPAPYWEGRFLVAAAGIDLEAGVCGAEVPFCLQVGNDIGRVETMTR